METAWANALAAGNRVEVDIRVNRSASGARPDSFDVKKSRGQRP